MKFTQKLLMVIFLIITHISLCLAQMSPAEFSKVKVDELSNSQIKEFIAKYKSAGYTLDNVEHSALQGGMPASEWAKMKSRILALEDDKEIDINRSNVESDIKTIDEDKPQIQENPKNKIFGASLFNNSKVTFEPNLRLPTPDNYILGTDDELIIDVHGLSENIYQLRVSPEGFIRIPIVGLIQVNGLTIAQARNTIIKKLSSIYTTIQTNETNVSVSLGSIRSIKIILIGEVEQPGTYTLPSVATVFNALVASGGPNKNGSFRDIKLIRNNKQIAKIDIYDFLVTGELKNNLILQDQDVIKIEPYHKRIELEGELKNTGLFESIDNENLNLLIKYAGGFTSQAYKDRITVIRNTNKEKSIADVSFDNFSNFALENGDHFVIGKVLDRFINKVEIEGAVYRPGIYSLDDGTTAKNLIEKADGITEDAFIHRAIIIREKQDRTKELISFDLGKLLNGEIQDIPLKKEDRITIESVLNMRENLNVSISGEVMKEGSYPYYEGMSIKDLLFLAGGTKHKAELSEIEVFRVITDSEKLKTSKERVQSYKFSIDKNLSYNDNASNFQLNVYDQVVIRPIYGLESGKKIKITGEVFFPGSYIITTKEERISNLIKRAGGINEFAYAEGAYLIRSPQTEQSEKALDNLLISELSQNDSLISTNKFKNTKGLLGIDLPKIMKNPHSKWDLLLEENDVIHIPRKLETVHVDGEVFVASYIRYDQSFSFKDYVNQAGGFSNNALKRKSFVIHANGTAMGTKKVLFFNKYPKVKPGSQLYIPQKPPRKEGSTRESIAVATSATSMAAMLIALFNSIL